MTRSTPHDRTGSDQVVPAPSDPSGIPASSTAPAPAPAVPATMTAATTRRYGGPDVVAIEEVPVPRPAAGEVLVRVEASSLNALDWHYLTGTPYFLRLMAGLRRPKRLIPGADVAGVVVSAGPGVTTLGPGDEVFGYCHSGGCAPWVTVEASKLVAKPEGVSFEAAAATPLAGLTALQGLRTHGQVQPGERVLVNGAAGGVGTFAVQIAVALGAEVTAVCSSGNVAMVADLGATTVIDYTTTDFVAAGDRFDVVFDNVGNRTAAEYQRVLLPGGRYVVVTGPKTNRWVGPLPKLLGDARAFRRAEPSFHRYTASADGDDLTTLAGLLADGRVVPRVDRVVGLDGVAAGLAELGTAHTRAKIVVTPH